MVDYDPKEIAKCEICWWRAHHKKDWPSAIENMAAEYALMYSIKPKDAKYVVEARMSAAKEHDLAEKLEDSGLQEGADYHWAKAEKLLVKHFTLLKKAQEKLGVKK